MKFEDGDPKGLAQTKERIAGLYDVADPAAPHGTRVWVGAGGR